MTRSIFSLIFLICNLVGIYGQSPNITLQNVKQKLAQLDSTRALFEIEYNQASYKVIAHNLKQ